MTATTPLPNPRHPGLYPPHLGTFPLLEQRDDPLAISIVPWLAQVLVADRLPAGSVPRPASADSGPAERSGTTGDRSRAEVVASPHHRLALARAGAAAFVEIIDELLAMLGEGEQAPAPVLGAGQTTPPDGLISPREREVLALVAAGRSNKEIAEALFISPFTVKAHVASLLTKLDADNRAQLAGIAVRRGLLAA